MCRARSASASENLIQEYIKVFKAKTKILIPAGALGIPYDRDALARGLKENPDLIAIDGGSTDSGPYYLGTGRSKYSRNATKADWADLMAARTIANVPLLIGTAELAVLTAQLTGCWTSHLK